MPAVLRDAITRLREASTRAGIVPGIAATSAARGAKFAAEGFRMISLRADFLQLADGVKRDLDAAREAESPTDPPGSDR